MAKYQEILRRGLVKTRAGRRDLTVLTLAVSTHGARPDDATDNDLAFRAKTGNSIELRSLVRSFQRICTQHDIRVIRIHDIRRTTATLLKNVGIPVRDVQLILGHSHVSVTQQIYQHGDMESRRGALARVQRLFMRTPDLSILARRCRQLYSLHKITSLRYLAVLSVLSSNF